VAPRPTVEQYKQLIFFATPEVVLLVRVVRTHYKVARITFGKDGSIYVQFPYCIEKSGWIGELPINADHEGPQTYSLTEHGEYVVTDVKFSHHRSGIAQFSKSGVELPDTRRQSFPLNGPIGHVFNLQVFQPHRFTVLEKPSPKAKYLALDFPDDRPASVSWRAEWRRKDSIVSAIEPLGDAGPKSIIKHKVTGAENETFFVGQPPGYPLREHILLVTGGPSNPPIGQTSPGMAFLGGWDPHEISAAGEKPQLRGCLAFIYPATKLSQSNVATSVG
jgi:hypothetical protein